uniref:Uncharacterized protein n=1 Tax=Amphimedon queenslandica TaxID=400682 RepID=A0A1X7US76_AMPQE
CYKEDLQNFNRSTMKFTLLWKSWYQMPTSENLSFPLKGALSPKIIPVITPSISNFWQRYTREIISFCVIVICIMSMFYIENHFPDRTLGRILCLLLIFLLVIVLVGQVLFLLDRFYPEITRGTLLELLKQILTSFSQLLQGL